MLTPLVKTLIFSLMYRLLSAALQPVSDNRIVDGIEAVARAGNLYYIVIRDASILFFSDCDSMCIYKLYGRLIGHEELFVSGIFFMVMTYLTPKEQYRRYFRFMLGVFLAVIILKPLAAGYEYDMRFAELTKKIEGISYEYDADTTDLFTAFEAEEN